MTEPQRKTLAALMCARGFRVIEGPIWSPTLAITGDGVHWRPVESNGLGATYESDPKHISELSPPAGTEASAAWERMKKNRRGK